MLCAARPPLRRMTAIDRALRANRYPSAASLAEELEVNRRTILRDVGFMRDTFGAPIAVCRQRRGYYYTEPDFRFPFFTLTEGELVSLFVAERVLRQYRGTPFEADLSRAFRKITEQLGDEITVNVSEFDEAHSFRISAPTPQDVETFGRLAAAVRARRRLRITYWTASRDAVTERTIDPLHLTNVDGDWFLLAWCHLRGRVQTFAPPRIRKLRETDETFAPPEGFSPAGFLAHSFRVIQDERGPVHHVRLRFSPFAARYVRERTWHPSQKRTSLAGGGCELELDLASLIEVKKWALSFGADCEVLDPPELRRQVADEARQMADRHAAASPIPSAVCSAADPSAARGAGPAAQAPSAPAKPDLPRSRKKQIAAPSKPRRTRPKR